MEEGPPREVSSSPSPQEASSTMIRATPDQLPWKGEEAKYVPRFAATLLVQAFFLLLATLGFGFVNSSSFGLLGLVCGWIAFRGRNPARYDLYLTISILVSIMILSESLLYMGPTNHHQYAKGTLLGKYGAYPLKKNAAAHALVLEPSLMFLQLVLGILPSLYYAYKLAAIYTHKISLQLQNLQSAYRPHNDPQTLPILYTGSHLQI